jgi:uncharacterized protein (DUF1778 family)
MPDSSSTTIISARIRPDEAEQLRQAAEQQQVTLSALVARLLREAPRLVA